ncbi:uncharacterized protein LOC133856704 [Alnus glutinosa]|uniref:uncharacterized protein LOC133856704 n=1 Tax=Alnus glutinosa TaxID=3517 RepID=UPI002D790018|nr:uncharacterized protein LOC133856704 [Alnus glutinosa]
MKVVMRFGKKGKLNPRFIRPSEINKRVGKLAYQVALPSNLAGMHAVFHVWMKMKFIPNPNLVAEYEPLGIQEGMTYKEMPIRILDRKEQVLRTKKIPSIKLSL